MVIDGLSDADAEIAAARRYLPYGRSFLDSMRALFPGATAIHGFASVSPAGSHIQQTLRQYLIKRGRRSPTSLSMRVARGSPTLNHRLCSIRGARGRGAFVQQLTESLQRGEIGLDAFDLADSTMRLTPEEALAVKAQASHRLDEILTKVQKLSSQRKYIIAMRLLQSLGTSGLIDSNDLRARQRAVLIDSIKAQPDGVEIKKAICDLSYIAPLASLINIADLPGGRLPEQKQSVQACMRAWK